MESKNFYQQLPSFSDFHDITEGQHFTEVPQDWMIFLTDVKGSTKAIEEGRYRDVNTVGAAAIVCAQNAMGGMDFPYVFGGDGATMLVPPAQVFAVKRELSALRNLAQKQFALELRVGAMSIAELRRMGGKVEVAKFALVADKCVAVFRGGGLALAEVEIKSKTLKYDVADPFANAADLTGLSCRWQPIKNKNGTILSLLVAARGPDSEGTYQLVLQKLSEIFGGEVEAANPVNLNSMVYKALNEIVADESRKASSAWSFSYLGSVLNAAFVALLVKLNISTTVFNLAKYRSSMKTHCDYRKFDDMLRMIVDCSPEQRAKIERCFADLHMRGKIFYWLFSSQSALMTCYVHSIADGQHIHFVDGGDGGYAMAARQLKAQIKYEEAIALQAA